MSILFSQRPHICLPSCFSASANSVLSPHRVPLLLLLRHLPPPRAQELQAARKTKPCSCQRRSSPLSAWTTITRLPPQLSQRSSPLLPSQQLQAHQTHRRMVPLPETPLRRPRHLIPLFPRLPRALMVEATHQAEHLALVHQAPAAHLGPQMTTSQLHCH